MGIISEAQCRFDRLLAAFRSEQMSHADFQFHLNNETGFKSYVTRQLETETA